MQVKLTIPDHVWGKLATHADANQVKVADLITDAITGIIAPAAETQKTVADLVIEGYPDPVIAHMRGRSIESVRFERRQAGLKANTFRRERWSKELAA